MRQHNPPHPGKFIRRTYLEPYGISVRQVAIRLEVAPSTFSKLVVAQSKLTPYMEIRLSKVLGRSPQSWLQMQMNYGLWQAERSQPHQNLKRLELLRN